MAPKNLAMFRIEEIHVDARNLAEVLWLLSGKVRHMSAPQPMINVARASNGSTAPRVSSGEFVDLFMAWMRERKLKEVNTIIAREFLAEHGRSPTSTSHLFNQARKRGLLKNVGSGPSDSRWQVLAGKRTSAKKKPAKPKPRTKPKAKAAPASAAQD